MIYHYLDQYIASAQHKITINVVGCGGTGSHVLTNLAMMNYSLVKLGRQPLFVRAWDPDEVTEHNVGRQIFSPADIGRNKAEVLIERINRFYGLHWHHMDDTFSLTGGGHARMGANFTISCVDTVKSRKGIDRYFHKTHNDALRDQYYRTVYWMDVGNSRSSGQVILGTVRDVKQPGNGPCTTLPRFTQEYPGAKDDRTQPSCSMAEALGNQDLFINKLMATYATHMLWEFLINYRLDYRGIYLNLADMKVSPITITYDKEESKKGSDEAGQD